MQQDRLSSQIFKALGIDNMPFGNNIVVTGLGGIGKSVLCINLISECLGQKEENRIICATLDVTPEDVRAKVGTLCPDGSEKPEKIVFIDDYSWLLGEVNEARA